MGQYAIEDLKLAFSLHVVDLIVAADDQIDAAELAFIEDRFPPSTLVARGLANADGTRTDAYHDAAMQALELLPTALTFEQKRDLIGVFFEATVADGAFALEEGSALLDGARLLGLEDSEVQILLDQWGMAGGASVEELDAAGD